MNFIRNIISKLFSLVFYFGLLLVAFGLMEMFENRKLSTDPVPVVIENLSSVIDGERKFVSVTGGRMDLNNSLERALKREGKKLTLSLYTPVYDENNKLVILFKTKDVSALALAVKNNTVSGLLQDAEMTEHIRFQMEENYGEEIYHVIDNRYKAESVIEQIKGMKNAIFITLFGLIGLIIFRDRRKVEAVVEE